MKLLKDAGSFAVLTSRSELKNQLLRIERAGRTCYQSERKEITEETAKKFIQMLLKCGHESVLEHSCMVVQFNNLSRGFTHELVRHRLASFSQESTRYVDYTKSGKSKTFWKGKRLDLEAFQLKCIAPPHRDENEKVMVDHGREMSIADMFAEIEKFYRGLRKAGWAPQDARQVLPIGIKSQIVVSANFREWRHIFRQRTSKYAHWEIRKVMCDLVDYIKPILSPIFDNFVEAGTDADGLRYFDKG